MKQTPSPTDQNPPLDDMADDMAQLKATAADQPLDPATTKETEEALLEKVLEYKNVAMRATADYRNLQRETDARLADIRKFATEELLRELCPLVDYFDSAFAAIPEDQTTVGWVQGVRHIQDCLLQILRNNQVERMKTIGQQFNPALHESVGAEASDQPDHTILKEMQAGFLMNGKVIRPARVIISQGNTMAAENKSENQNQNTTSHHN